MAVGARRTSPIQCAWPCTVAAGTLSLLITLTPSICAADEGGAGFWLPGQFGSMAATPQTSGFSLATIYYHTSVDAGANVTASREITIGKYTPNLTVNLNGSVNARGDMALIVPSYVFSEPVLGGQAAFSVTGLYGGAPATLAATLSGTLGGVPFFRSDSISDTEVGFGDLYPQFSLRWNAGVHNVMTYVTGDVPVGAYSSTRLSNIGLGHGAVDGGVGYTYFDPQTKWEASAVVGLTANLENNETHYKSGNDLHLDWAASRFLNDQLHVGIVGYTYYQVSADSGSGAELGSFKSRVNGIGPQIGFLFPVGDMQGYLNLKGYKEFGAENRPEGWNAWLTFAISPTAPAAVPPKP